MALNQVTIGFGGVGVRIDGSPAVCAALATRFAPFLAGGSEAAIHLEVREREPFEPQLELPSGASRLRWDGEVVRLDSPAGSGFIDVGARRGELDDATGLGAIDAVVRAALSLVLPLDGALLLHGALAGGTAFLGDSGAGKSTVARALGAACDELVIARPSPRGVRLYSTPYWGGRPLVCDGGTLVCLSRGAGTVESLAGAAALRTVLRHAVRYVAWPDAERALLSVATKICQGTRVLAAACPTGEAFLPFLLPALEVAA
jgi:hypothetical protein